jgi:hypothetical protein
VSAAAYDPTQRGPTLDAAARGPALLALPEDQWFDRKSSRVSAQELANTLIGFANAELRGQLPNEVAERVGGASEIGQ